VLSLHQGQKGVVEQNSTHLSGQETEEREYRKYKRKEKSQGHALVTYFP
jgi:hypothetical protein